MLAASHMVRHSIWSLVASAYRQIPTRSATGSIQQPVSTSIQQGNPFLFRMDNQLCRGDEFSTRSHRWSQRDALSGPHLLEDCVSLQTAVAGAPRPLVPLPPDQGAERGSSPRPPSEPVGVAEAMPGSCSCSRAQARSCAPGGAASERGHPSGGNVA
jgi:hypothetical protein